MLHRLLLSLPRTAPGVGMATRLGGRGAAAGGLWRPGRRPDSNGSSLRLKDVARIQPGAQSYAISARLNRKPSTGVFGGMITAVLLSVLFVPLFFVVVRRFFKPSERQRLRDARETAATNPNVPLEDR